MATTFASLIRPSQSGIRWVRSSSFLGQTFLSPTTSKLIKANFRTRRRTLQTTMKAKDPDSWEAAEEESPNQRPPTILWRCMAALMYLIPWIDTIALGRDIYHSFPFAIYLYYVPGPFVGMYFSTQFAPLIVFFLVFLAIVRNTKLHHFVRFNAMQSIMIDIVVMLFNIVRLYFPSELRWSSFLTTFDNFSWMSCMSTILYCIIFCLMGRYADIPYVSDAVYIQVEQSEYF
eukprot:TRINITY_DN25636_c0_g1_i4.p1 TRINITY_DN25636_c0_g1~~TRINITY_DN25636_c0_g1_i4.p1  ORF type:complete len:261 (-),score=14.72 TRINITY_DN25636_c0_g1_i4:237-929(-)